MLKVLVPGLGLVALFTASDCLAFGSKKMQVSELNGVTETQVASADGKATVMVRGKAAELIFRMLKEDHQQQAKSGALEWVKNKDATHITVKGKQVSCSKIARPDGKQQDYACNFLVDQEGRVAAGNEAFDPAVFNLARTETGSKLFKRKASRGLASATSAAYSKSGAYLMFAEKNQKKDSEKALIVIKGNSAREVLSVLESNASNKPTKWGSAVGRKGDEIACVGATANEPERCAIVVSFRDGAVTRKGNPLFR